MPPVILALLMLAYVFGFQRLIPSLFGVLAKPRHISHLPPTLYVLEAAFIRQETVTKGAEASLGMTLDELQARILPWCREGQVVDGWGCCQYYTVAV